MVQGIRKGKFIRVLAIAVAVPIVLLWVLLLLLYLPPVQEYATRRISEAVAANSDFEINVGSVGLSFPLKLAIKDFLLTQKEDTIAEGEEIAVSVGLLPLLRGEIEVDYLSLENIAVDTRDIIESTRIKGKVGYLRTVVRGIDLVAEKANIKQLNLHDTEVNIDIAKSNTANESSTPLKWIFELQKSNIENVKVAVNIPADSLSIATSVGEFNTKGVVADIGNSLYSTARLEIEGTSFLFDNAARRRSGTTPVAISGITLQGKNITYHHPIYAAKIEKLAFAQDGGSHPELFKTLRDCLTLIYSSSKPVIACVEGNVTAGGVGLVAACDLVLATENVVFMVSEVILKLLEILHISQMIMTKM